MRSAVDIGVGFEELVVKMLKTYGLEAYRTNKTNIHDPEGYKHGFDGGVDIIATFQTSLKRTEILFSSYSASVRSNHWRNQLYQRFMQACISEKALEIPVYL